MNTPEEVVSNVLSQQNGNMPAVNDAVTSALNPESTVQASISAFLADATKAKKFKNIYADFIGKFRCDGEFFDMDGSTSRMVFIDANDLELVISKGSHVYYKGTSLESISIQLYGPEGK